MLLGVVRKGGRGVPSCILQEAVTKKEDLCKVRGTLKVSQLIGDSELPSLLAVSIYDSKPVYLMSNSAEQVKWLCKERHVCHKEMGKKVKVPFHRLNLIDQYNYTMNNIDIADQLRGTYQFDHWMCKRKWWWSISLTSEMMVATLVFCGGAECVFCWCVFFVSFAGKTGGKEYTKTVGNHYRNCIIFVVNIRPF